MFKLTNEKLLNQEFYQALQNLGAVKFTSFQTSYHIGQIIKAVNEKFKGVGEQYNNSIVKEFCQMGDDGKPVPVAGLPGRFNIDPERKEDFEKVRDEFYEVEVEFPYNQILSRNLAEARLSANESILLEELILPPTPLAEVK